MESFISFNSEKRHTYKNGFQTILRYDIWQRTENGYNGADLKSDVPWRTWLVGSNPTAVVTKN